VPTPDDTEITTIMANLKIVAVTFDIDVQNKAAQFSVPEEVCRLLGVEKGDVALTIRDRSGRLLFDGIKKLKSGRETYGRNIRDCGVKPGQRIRVEVSLPPVAGVRAEHHLALGLVDELTHLERHWASKLVDASAHNGGGFCDHGHPLGIAHTQTPGIKLQARVTCRPISSQFG
jgi:hypothetical protein